MCSMKHYEGVAGVTTQKRQHVILKDMEKYDPVLQVHSVNFIQSVIKSLYTA